MPPIRVNGDDLDGIHALLKDNEPFLLTVFADWCGHCVRLKESQWPSFLASAQGAVVELDYEAFSEISKDKFYKDCLFAKILKKSVSSFPFVALVKNSPSEVNVRIYDGSYPIDAAKLSAFVAEGREE